MKVLALVVICFVATSSASVTRSACTDNGGACRYSCRDDEVVDLTHSCGLLSTKDCCIIDTRTQEPIGTTVEPEKDSCGTDKYGKPGVGAIEQIFPSKPYVVGGMDTLPNEYPWQVSLQKTSHTCGGSIIDKRWILSAAHCFSTTATSSWRVLAGKHHLKETDDTEVTYRVEKVIKHEAYSSSKSNANDVALMKLTEDIEFNMNIQPICLPPATYPTDGEQLIATGWGTTSSGGSLAGILQEVTVPAVTNADCDAAYRRENVTLGMVCAGNMTYGGIDTCQGDSGGPLIHNAGNGSFVQVGITSWGYGCASAGSPGVYTRVSYYADWIWRQISSN